MLFVPSLYGFTLSPWEKEGSTSKSSDCCQCGNGKFHKTSGAVHLPDAVGGAVQRASHTVPASRETEPGKLC